MSTIPNRASSDQISGWIAKSIVLPADLIYDEFKVDGEDYYAPVNERKAALQKEISLANMVNDHDLKKKLMEILDKISDTPEDGEDPTITGTKEDLKKSFIEQKITLDNLVALQYIEVERQKSRGRSNEPKVSYQAKITLTTKKKFVAEMIQLMGSTPFFPADSLKAFQNVMLELEALAPEDTTKEPLTFNIGKLRYASVNKANHTPMMSSINLLPILSDWDENKRKAEVYVTYVDGEKEIKFPKGKKLIIISEDPVF